MRNERRVLPRDRTRTVRRMTAWGKQLLRGSWPPPPRSAAAASRCSARSLTGCCGLEAKVARKAIGRIDAPVPDATGWYGRGRPGPAIKIALLGDSSAAGYGVDKVEETPGAVLGSGVAAGADRRVHLREFCVSGAKSIQLASQVDAAIPTEPDVAVILIGANDVTNQTLPSESVRYLSEAVRRLHEPTSPWSSAPARTSGPCARSRSRCARSPAPGRAGSPRRRRSRSSRRAAGRCRSARSSARSSTPPPRCSSVRTASTPPPPGTPRWPACWSPPPSQRSASARTDEELPGGAARRGRAADRPGRRPGDQAPGHRARRDRGRRRARAARLVAGSR